MLTFGEVKNYTGKILSFLFLFNLLFIQGVNIAEAHHLPVVIHHYPSYQQHYTSSNDLCGTVSLICETDEMDDDEKLLGKFSRLDAASFPLKFFLDFVAFSFPNEPSHPAPISRSAVFSRQGVSLLQVHCSFLI